jgi:hypothetical protein
MILLDNKYYILFSFVNSNHDIYSPSMPYKWKWANGPTDTFLPLAIFNNSKDIEKIKNILLQTYPAKSNSATLHIKSYDPLYCIYLTKFYNIKINRFYLQSFKLKIDESFTIDQLVNLFSNDSLN